MLALLLTASTFRLALLAPTPEGYGVGLEPMVYGSFILPALLLLAIWWLARRRIV